MSRPAPGPERRDDGAAALPISRSLLFPGPMAPLSHLGATLLRHVVASSLRYALYQLGLPPPDRPPVRIHRLRLYLDGPELGRVLAAQPGGDEIARALVDPGGRAAPGSVGGAEGTGLAAASGRSTGAAGNRTEPVQPRRLAGAVAFHRWRLRLMRPLRGGVRRIAEPSAAAAWDGLRRALTRRLPALHDAFLGELLAALARRRRRAAGREVPPCLGPEAWRRQAGRRARLDHLGPPDPLSPSWAEEVPALLSAKPDPLPPRDPDRGRFRERYRATLDALRPALLAIAGRAHARGLLASPDDAFFLPFDLGDDLELEPAPSWLAPAVATNRREHAALFEAHGPPEVLAEPLATLGGDDRPAWVAQPLAPLV